MVTKERREEIFELWLAEQNDSWREDLTDEERQLVEGWDRETPEEELSGVT